VGNRLYNQHHHTLVAKYSGTGGTGTGYKLGVTDTGTSAGPETTIQGISASGSSGNLINISGGWNLSGTPAQDGYTWFLQSGANKYGYGLYIYYINYINLDSGRVGFLRYNRGIYLYCSNHTTIASATCNSNGYGISVYYGNNNTITLPTCNGNAHGLHIIITSYNNTFTSPSCNSNSNSGIFLEKNCYNNTFTSPTCNNNTQKGIGYETNCRDDIITSATCNSNGYGIYISGCRGIIISSPTCNDNSTQGIYLIDESNCICIGYSHNESTWNNAVKIDSWKSPQTKVVSLGESESGGAARNRVYFYGGYTQDNAAEADGGTGKCLQFNPKSATYWIEQDFVVPVTASTARTVAIKMKDDASFNGSVYLELWYLGVLIVGPTAKTMTETYASQEMTATSGQITADGVLTLKVKVYGTAGAVYADTLSYT